MFTTYKKRGLILLSVIISALMCLVGALMLAPQKKAAIAEDGAVDYAATVTFGSDVTEYSTFADAWAYANGLATTETTTATVKMFADATTTSTLTVESGKNITLNLNGCMLKRTGSGSVISVVGNFTLKDSNPNSTHYYTVDSTGLWVFGTATAETPDANEFKGGVITGGNAGNGGGVYVNGGRFHMESGAICGNTAFYTGGGVSLDDDAVEFVMENGQISGNTARASTGGGVAVYTGKFVMYDGIISYNKTFSVFVGGGVCASNDFEMYGGKICNNTSGGNGGGVYVGSTFKVSGAPEIYGNIKSDGSDNNVYLSSGEKITVVGELTDPDDPTKKAKIGVTLEYGTGAVATGYGENNKDASDNIISPSTYFIPDKAGFVPVLDGEVKLVLGAATVTVGNTETIYGTFADAWTAASAAGTATVTMYADAQISATLNVSSNVTLDLNGHTLQMTGSGAVVYIMGSGTFTLDDSVGGGVLTGGNNNVGGGVCGDEGSTFIMMGGEISGNEADSGGGGVYIYSGTFKVSGDVNITGNTSDGAANNVCLENTIITVTDELTVGAQIGISYTGIVATGFTQNGKPSDYFIPDDPDYCIYLSDSAGTVAAGEHDWVLVNDEYNHWPECSVCGATDENSTEPHSGTDDNDCTTPINCSSCGRELTEGQQSHDWSTVWESDNYGHWHECQRTDCTQTSTKVEHSLVNYTCECGYTAYFEVTENNVKSYYKTIEAAFASVTDDATVKMLADAVTTDTLTVPRIDGKTLTLDLNGCMLKYNNADERNPAITVDGNFTLIDSNVDTTKKHSIPDPDNAGETIEVIGGLVTGGTGYYIFDHGEHSYGGGVYVTDGSTFTMTGGTISGNTADYGGGVYSSDYHFNVSGAPVIIGNKSKLDGNTKENNVAARINVIGDLTEGAKIGVAIYGTVAVGYTQADDPSKYFIPDNVEHVCICVIRDSFVEGQDLVHIDEHVWEWQYDIDNHKQVCYYCGETQNEGPHYLVNDECECGYSTVDCAVTVTFDGSVTEWDSIEEAFAHANSLPTTADKSAVIIMYDYAVTTDTLTVNEGKFITLDLNGRVLEYDNDDECNSVITVLGTFTLKDSKTTKKNEITDNDGKTIEVIGGLITGGTGYEMQSGGEVIIVGGGVWVDGGTFTMTGGTISGNEAEQGGGVNVNNEGTFNMAGGYIRGNIATVGIGGGVCVAGLAEFTLSGGTVSENIANQGGGVYVAYLGTFIMTGGTIGGVSDADGNSAQAGGGVAVHSGGSFTMNGGTIGYNIADDAGGGVYVDGGAVTISGGAISGNTSFAGGVAMQDGTVTMTGGEISGNMAFMGGCGVYMLGGSFKMTGGAITGNMPVPSEDDTEDMSLGGGVVVSGGTFELDGGSISGNTAQFAGGVLIAEGTFIMKSGSISDNTGVSGAGGILLIMGTLKISGGSITGNKQTEDVGFGYCGGVCVGFPLLGDENVETSFEISGASVITGNKVIIDGNEVENNVVVQEGYKITVAGALTDGAKIGVYVEAIGDIATGYNQAEKPSKYFIPDNPAYCVYVSDEDTGTVTIGEHIYAEDFTVDVQPTCTEKGSKSKHCTLCDGKSEVTEIDELGHSYGEFVIDKQPTCTEAGSKSKHCTRCDDKSEVTAIPTIPHTLNHNPAAPATEDKDGNIEYWDCEQCEKIFADEDGKTEITDRASIVIPKLKADDSSALWITVIILAIIVLALGGYIAFDVLRGKKKANGENAPASEPSAAEKPEPQADEQPAVEDEPAVTEDKAEEPAPEQIPEPPVAAEPQAVAAEDVPQIEPAPKAEKKTAEKKPTKSAAEKKSTKPTVEKKAEPKAAKPKPAPKAQLRAKEEKNKIAQNNSGVPETAAVIQKGDNAAIKPAVEKTLPPSEVRAEVTATEVDKIMTDEVAESFVEQSEKSSDKTKQGIINIDVLSQYFDGGEVVTLDEIKKRVNGFNKKTTYVKVLARGTLDKALTVEADSFSLQAVKMIVLTGGKVIKKKS